MSLILAGSYSLDSTFERKIILSLLKVHKRENFFGSDIEICTYS